MQTSTNRRGALMSLAKAVAATTALSVACGVSQCSTKANAATIDRSDWDRNLAAYNAAQAASERFDDTVLQGAQEAFAKAERAVPHVTFINGLGQKVSTASEAEVNGARRSLATVRYVERCAWEDVKAQQDLVDAADAREAKVRALPERAALDRAEAESERLSQASYAAYRKVGTTPVSALSLFQAKWAWIAKESDLHTWQDELTADLARIAAREA